MATLVSPGVSVTVTDESFYASAGPGTVPFVMIATQEDKPISAGSEVIDPDTAAGTISKNAGKLWLISSQRELLQTFGTPIFYSEGLAQAHGSPINEYGLLALHSYLGIANRAYVMRADIDTYELQGADSPLKIIESPTPPDTVPGPYWIDVATSDMALSHYDQDDDTWSKVSNFVFFETVADAESAQVDELTYAIVADGGKLLIYQGGLLSNQFVLLASDGSSEYETVYNLTFSATSVAPTGQTTGDTWMFTGLGAEDNGGTKLTIHDYNETTSEYDEISAPVLMDDDEANSYYADKLKENDVYANINENSSKIQLKRYDGSDWADVSDSEIIITIDDLPPNINPETNLPDGKMPLPDSHWYNPDPTVVDMLVSKTVPDEMGVDAVIWDEFDGQMYVQPDDPDLIDFQAPSDGDIWLDTNDLDNYPVLYSRNSGSWILLDNSDSSQVVFADARPFPGEDVDADAPNPALYDGGTILFNTRYSGRVVKQWKTNYTTDNGDFIGDRWITVSGLNEDGSLITGDSATKSVVVIAMKEAMNSSDDLRSEAIFFNLIATPGYPELIPEMLSLNVDRKEQGFVLGDSPFHLKANGTDIQAWATNEAEAPTDGVDGLLSTSPYLSVHYPGCAYTSNLDGNGVVVPPSHIMLRTCAYNDQVAYQWFAPAGLQRGPVTNATSVGYLDDEGEYVTTTLNQGLRDILYTNNINPIAVIPNRGLHVWGQKTRSPVASALDRINVARLINYIRYQTENAAYPYLFEPNDGLTRDNAKASMESIMSNLVTLRGLYDFLVVCDESNNTSDRIDRNELWIDIAIQPVKTVEFIYIPIRVKNTGEDLAS